MIYTDDSYAEKNIRKRDRASHKGDFGRILIFAGSPGMAGAAVLCGRAALRTGSGLVQFLLPRLDCEIYPVLQTAVPEATCVEYTADFDFTKYDAIAAGSGIGQSETATGILKDILTKYGTGTTMMQSLSSDEKAGSGETSLKDVPKRKTGTSLLDADTLNLISDVPKSKSKTLLLDADTLNLISDVPKSKSKTLLLDADALNLISKYPELTEAAKNASASVIITPHIGEAKRLLDTCAGIGGFSARKNAACDLAEKLNCIAVLKGAGTLVAVKNRSGSAGTEDTNPDTGSGSSLFQIFENTTGNPGMATAGSGDVLSGIITSLAGQGYDPVTAARLGVFIHGRAGDIAAEKLGEMSVTAGDLVDNIPDALKYYYNK